MPPVIPAVAAMAAAMAANLTLAQVLILGAISLTTSVLGGLLAPKPSAPSYRGEARDRKQVIRSAIQSRRKIYGIVKASGPLIYAGSSGDGNKHVHIVIPLAGHQCNAIGDVYFNDKPASEYDSSYYRIKKHLGSPDQEADPDLVAEVGEWTVDHRGQGVAYIYVRFLDSQDIWPTGLPNVSAVVEGALLYDPRTAITAFSANWALCMRDYLTAPVLGLGYAATDIDEVWAIASANISAEQVEVQPGVYQPRYTCNGVVDTSVDPAIIIDQLRSAGAGFGLPIQGQLRIIAGAYYAPTGPALTAHDLRGSLKVRPKPPRKDLFNGVRGVFTSPDNHYEPTDFPIVKNVLYKEQDGGVEIIRDIDLPFTNDPWMAQRIAKIVLEKSRQGIVVEFPANWGALNRCVGETVYLDFDGGLGEPSLGWSDKVFRIESWALAQDGGGIDLVLQEEAAASYAWNYGEATIVDPAPDTSLASTITVASPTNVTWAEDDYAIDGSGLLSWEESTSAWTIGYRVQYRLTGTAIWITVPGNIRTNQLTIRDLTPGDYEFAVQTVNIVGRTSAWGIISGSVSRPPVIARVSGLELYDGYNIDEFTGRDAKFTWRESSHTSSYELGSEEYGADNGSRDLYFMDYEVRVYGSGSTLLRTERVVDNHYTYTYEKNAEDYARVIGSAGAHRSFTLEVYQRGRQGQISAKPARLTVTNPPPAQLTGLELLASPWSIIVVSNKPDDLDYAGIIVWLSDTPGFDPLATTPYYKGPNTTTAIWDRTPDTPYYLRVAGYDGFGMTGLNISAELLVRTVQILEGDLADEVIIARHLKAQIINGTHILAEAQITIADGGFLQVGNNVRIDSGAADNQGKITVTPDVFDAAHRKYTTLTEGNIFINYRLNLQDPGQDVTYNTLKRIEFGAATNNVLTRIPGYFTNQPQVILFPNNLLSFHASYSGQSQTFKLDVLDVHEVTPGSMEWYFTPLAQLEVAGNTGSDLLSQTLTSASDITTTYRYCHGGDSVTAATLTIKAKSVHTSATAGVYYRRKMRYRLDYYNGTTYNGTLSGFITLPADTTTYTTISQGVSGLANYPWQFRMFCDFEDEGSTFGGSSYEYAYPQVNSPNTDFASLDNGANNSGACAGWAGVCYRTCAMNYLGSEQSYDTAAFRLPAASSFSAVNSYLSAGYSIISVAYVFNLSLNLLSETNSTATARLSKHPSWSAVQSWSVSGGNNLATTATHSREESSYLTDWGLESLGSYSSFSSSTSQITCTSVGLTFTLRRLVGGTDAVSNETVEIKIDYSLGSAVVLDEDGTVTYVAIGD